MDSILISAGLIFTVYKVDSLPSAPARTPVEQSGSSNTCRAAKTQNKCKKIKRHTHTHQSPHAISFFIGTAVINTHTHKWQTPAQASLVRQGPRLSTSPRRSTDVCLTRRTSVSRYQSCVVGARAQMGAVCPTPPLAGTRGHTARISSSEQRLHSGPGRNVADIRSVNHPRDPSRRVRVLCRVLQNLEEPAPCGLIKPLDPVLFGRRKLGDNTLEVKKPNELCPALAKTLREHKLITRLPPQLGCPGRKIRAQQRQQSPMQTKCCVIRRWRVSKGSASQTQGVAFETPRKFARPRSSLSQ